MDGLSPALLENGPLYTRFLVKLILRTDAQDAVASCYIFLPPSLLYRAIVRVADAVRQMEKCDTKFFNPSFVASLYRHNENLSEFFKGDHSSDMLAPGTLLLTTVELNASYLRYLTGTKYYYGDTYFGRVMRRYLYGGHIKGADAQLSAYAGYLVDREIYSSLDRASSETVSVPTLPDPVEVRDLVAPFRTLEKWQRESPDTFNEWAGWMLHDTPISDAAMKTAAFAGLREAKEPRFIGIFKALIQENGPNSYSLIDLVSLVSRGQGLFDQ